MNQSRMKVLRQVSFLYWFFSTLAVAATGGFADRFVKTEVFVSATKEPTELVIYGNSDYGYFETQDFSEKVPEVSVRLVPPGFRSPIYFTLKKRRPDGTSYFERVGERKFSFPLSSHEITHKVILPAGKFTSNFFLAQGSFKPLGLGGTFILNRFSEIVWFYTSSKPMDRLYCAEPLGNGRYALLEKSGQFEIFNFDGTIEKSVNFSVETHHELLMGSSNTILTFGFQNVNFAGKAGLKLDPGIYTVGTMLELDPVTGSSTPLWNAFDDSVSLLAQRTAPTPWDFDHINSIFHVEGKGYLVSARNLNSLLFLDEAFKMVWSLGSAPGATINTQGTNLEFSGQHHASFLPNGNILLFDNGSTTSRVLELKVDEVDLSARMVQEFLPDPPLFSATLGSAYRLQNGSTVALIANRIVEFDSIGKQTARMEKIPTDEIHLFYRAKPVDTIGSETYFGTTPPW
jgi:hypothetical protein